MSDSQGSPSNDGSSPPSDGNQTPSEDSSPSGSNSPESPDSAGNPSPDSPPSDSRNTPPSDSDNSLDTNTPSSPSDSGSSPPPPQESDSSPPPDSKGGDPPPPPPPPKESDSSPPSDSNNDGNSTPPPPPPSDDKNTPSDSPPAPKSSKDSPSKSDKGNKSSPPSSDNQNSPSTDNQSPPPRGGTQSNNSHVPEPSGPSTHSNRNSISDATSSSRSSSGSGKTIDTGTVAGATVAGVLIIAFIALFLVVARKRKRRPLDHYDPYRPQPPNYTGNSEGYYYGGPHSQQHSQTHSQQHLIGMPGGHSQEYHSGGRPPAYPNSGPMNSYDSYKGPDSGTLGGAQSSFTYDELMGVTQGFSLQNVIGEGGFGAVYKGHLPDGRIVAVKQLKAGSGQGEREFRAEVEIISRVHHRHLVSLVGYCIADAQRLLVYEFVPNNTLEHHIHTRGLPVLDWSKRVKIAIGGARGLAYLHEDCHPKIIHRDIKSANILLDNVYEAQVADFGLAKLSNDITTHVSTRVMGTFGYMAPEYASSGKLTDRSDVFSFGVVLLELVTGRRPIEANEDESLVEWARPLIASAIETGDFSEFADPRLEKRYVESEMFRMAETAAACVRHSATKRPRMVQVSRALDTDGEMPDINNGVKVGQSTIFDTNSDLQKFRMLALGGNDSADYSVYSGSMNSKAEILPPKPPPGWTDESETRAINPRK